MRENSQEVFIGADQTVFQNLKIQVEGPALKSAWNSCVKFQGSRSRELTVGKFEFKVDYS